MAQPSITQNRAEEQQLKELDKGAGNPPHPAAAAPGPFSKVPPSIKPTAPGHYGAPLQGPIFSGGNK